MQMNQVLLHGEHAKSESQTCSGQEACFVRHVAALSVCLLAQLSCLCPWEGVS